MTVGEFVMHGPESDTTTLYQCTVIHDDNLEIPPEALDRTRFTRLWRARSEWNYPVRKWGVLVREGRPIINIVIDYPSLHRCAQCAHYLGYYDCELLDNTDSGCVACGYFTEKSWPILTEN